MNIGDRSSGASERDSADEDADCDCTRIPVGEITGRSAACPASQGPSTSSGRMLVTSSSSMKLPVCSASLSRLC
jgi:hypothetical protein